MDRTVVVCAPARSCLGVCAFNCVVKTARLKINDGVLGSPSVIFDTTYGRYHMNRAAGPNSGKVVPPLLDATAFPAVAIRGHVTKYRQSARQIAVCGVVSSF